MRVRAKTLKKRFFKIFRLVHIYSSTALFALLIFFTITGITLNHRWYMAERNSESFSEYAVAVDQLHALSSTESEQWQPDVTAILAFLHMQHGMKAPASIEIDELAREVIVEYRAPASFASAILSFNEQRLVVETEQGAALGVLNDLHKGRHSGVAWRWLIDISAGLILVFSLSGLIILFNRKNHRNAALAAAVIGALSPVAFYFLWVPSVG